MFKVISQPDQAHIVVLAARPETAMYWNIVYSKLVIYARCCVQCDMNCRLPVLASLRLTSDAYFVPSLYKSRSMQASGFSTAGQGACGLGALPSRPGDKGAKHWIWTPTIWPGLFRVDSNYCTL
jgi:hypothetical protein